MAITRSFVFPPILAPLSVGVSIFLLLWNRLLGDSIPEPVTSLAFLALGMVFSLLVKTKESRARAQWQTYSALLLSLLLLPLSIMGSRLSWVMILLVALWAVALFGRGSSSDTLS